ncbi:MAG: DMT family transporter [Candidatus Cryptobacteroides sp.]
MQKGTGNSFFHILAIVIVAIWGLTFISTKVLLQAGLSPEEIFLVRFSIAYFGMLLFCLPGRKGESPGAGRLFCSSLKDELLLMLAGVMGGSLYFWSENTALQYTLASNVSFIVCTTPLVTAFLYALIRKERLGRMTLVGGLISLSGIAMIAFSGAEGFHLGFIGDSLAMLASLSWAVYTIVTDALLKKYPSAMVSRKVFFYGMLTIIPLLMVKGWHFPLGGFLEAKVLLNVLFLAVVASLGCYALWNAVIRRLGTVGSSNYIYLNPLFTLMGATFILGERLTPVAVCGCVITLLGVWLASRRSS